MTEEATFRSRLTWVSLVRGILRIVVNKAENIPDPSDSLAVGNEAEETATEHSEDRVVLEQEPDDVVTPASTAASRLRAQLWRS
jgi:hypothetical protein